MSRMEEITKRKAEIRAALDGNGKVDLDALEKELRGLNEEQAELERRQQIANGIQTGEVRSMEIEKPEMNKVSFESEEYRHAFMEYVCRGTEIPKEYRKAENTKTGDVGVLIPPTVLNRIVEKIEAYGMILPLITRTNFRTGMSIPTASIKLTASWVAEGAGADRQKLPLDAAIVFGHYKLQCRVSVSLETDHMAMSAFETRLINCLSEAMAKALEQAILTGTGSGQPTGVLKDTAKGVSIQTNKIDYKTLVDAEAALPMEYENGAVWVMSKKTFMEFAGMTDTAGQPIARVNYGIGSAPERSLLGRRVVLTNYLPAFASTLKTTDVFAMIYDFSDYTLNTNFEVGIKVFEDNETDDIVRKTTIVCDGKPIQYDSLVKLTGKAS